MNKKKSQIRHALSVSPNILLNKRSSAANCNTRSDINNSKFLSFLWLKAVVHIFPMKNLLKGLFITAKIWVIP